MNFAATIYVDADGTTYGASRTDQRHTTAAERTVYGRPVACAGRWYGSQMAYKPYHEAVRAAAERARAMTAR